MHRFDSVLRLLLPRDALLMVICCNHCGALVAVSNLLALATRDMSKHREAKLPLCALWYYTGLVCTMVVVCAKFLYLISFERSGVFSYRERCEVPTLLHFVECCFWL